MNGILFVGSLDFAAELEREEIGPPLAERDRAQVPEPTAIKNERKPGQSPLENHPIITRLRFVEPRVECQERKTPSRAEPSAHSRGRGSTTGPQTEIR